MSMKRLPNFSILLILFLVSTPLLADPVGQIAMLEGAVSLTKASGKRVFIAEGSAFDSGDTVTTGNDSKAILVFTDGGKIALRPNTVFQITNFNYKVEEPDQDNALFKLFKGGLRTVTGLVSKRGNRDAYHLSNQTSTIGIRGTEYLARVCDIDCDKELKPQTNADRPMLKESPIARVVLLKGDAFSEGPAVNKGKRQLVAGDALYQSDTVLTAGSATLGILFTDGTRIVVPDNSSFNLASYKYTASDASNDSNMLVELLKGSMRVVTGIIGKRNPRSVNYKTVTATIGIRGTDFDIACVSGGAVKNGELPDAAASSKTECDQAVASVVRHGAVEMDSNSGQQRIETDQAGYTDGPRSSPQLLAKQPKLFDDNTPLPGSLSDDVIAQFGSDPKSVPGIYVSVIEGKVEIHQGNGSLTLAAGESGFADNLGTVPLRLSSAPSSINYDPFLKGVKFEAFSCGLK